jgi:Uma2 family endonuclease
MPTRRHQVILALLSELFVATIRPHGGRVLFAPPRLRMRPGKFREADLVVLLDRHEPRNENAYWLGADVVVEIVSRDDPDRDIVTKRADYAEASISEYRIVNPLDETISVLTLRDDVYVEHGIFLRGERADSKLIESLSIGVDEVFDAQ